MRQNFDIWKSRSYKPTQLHYSEPEQLQDEYGEACQVIPLSYFDLLPLITEWRQYSVMLADYGSEAGREQKITEILEKLRSGVAAIQDSSVFRNYLSVMSRFYEYSIGNQILIMLQRPSATRVAGFNTWREMGRFVRKGEHGIAIFAPCLPKKPKPTEHQQAADNDEIVEEQHYRIYFRVVHVFDVSQTDGKPLPEVAVPVLTGEANDELFKKLLALNEHNNIVVSLESKPELNPDIKGFYSNHLIWIRPEESRAQQLKTLAHETAHYYSEDVFGIPRQDAETIAESAAFAVSAHYGFDTGVRSFPYIALWSKDKKILNKNLSYIKSVTTKIIDSITLL